MAAGGPPPPKRTTTPKHATEAGAFDRLVDATLDLVVSVQKQTASVEELTAEVRQLIRALARTPETR
jgi:hypothetical protein